VKSDVVLNRVATIERCLARIRSEYRDDPGRLEDYTIQDAVILNLVRACEASIDLAMHVVSKRRLGLPQESKEGFSLMVRAGILERDVGERLQRMVGFRNVAVHEYQEIDQEILAGILREHLGDFEAFCRSVLALAEQSDSNP